MKNNWQIYPILFQTLCVSSKRSEKGMKFKMKVSREEILHIANLAQLNLEESEIDTYLLHLQDILNFADIVNNAPVDGLDITIRANEAKNVFRKDEIKVFENNESLLQNAVSEEQNMFKIPKVIQ